MTIYDAYGRQLKRQAGYIRSFVICNDSGGSCAAIGTNTLEPEETSDDYRNEP